MIFDYYKSISNSFEERNCLIYMFIHKMILAEG